MSKTTYECKICGFTGLPYQHVGAVDCIAEYRRLVDELRSLLPQGKQVLCAPLDRETTARLWIDGPSTDAGLDRLITYVTFMRKAWFEPEEKATDGESECLSFSSETIDGQASETN
jgi:hypothetical protein